MSFKPIFFEGFETGGKERCTYSDADMTVSTTVRSGANGAYSLDDGTVSAKTTYWDLYEYTGSANSNAKGFGFWFSQSGTGITAQLVNLKDSTGANLLTINTNNTDGIFVRDQASTIVLSVNDVGWYNGVWTYVSVWYEEGSNAAAELWINGVQVDTATGCDFDAGNGNTSRIDAPSSGARDRYWDDFWFGECTAATDMPTGMDIFATTGDGSATTGGDSLSAGSWTNVQEIPQSDTLVASYNDQGQAATERIAPDTIAVQTNLTGSVTDIDDDPDSPDANWLTASGSSTLRTTFSTPTSAPVTGADLQEFRVLLRKDATGPSGSGTEDMLPTGTGAGDSNLSGDHTTMDDDPQSPGGDWRTASSNNANSVAHATFDTPTNTPGGTQTFEVYARLTANGTACDYSLDLYESGVLNTNVTTGSLTSTSGQLITGTFNASVLNTASGANVELHFTVTKSGGAPANRTTGEVDAVRWVSGSTIAETQPGYEVKLYENGSEVVAAGSQTGTLTDAGGDTVVSFTWDADNLGTADGSLVECYVNQTSGTDRYVEVGAVEWNARPPVAARDGWIEADSGTKAGPSGVSGLNTIVGMSTFIRTSYSGSGSTLLHSLYRGNDTDGTTQYSLGNATASWANFFIVDDSATIVPTTTEHSRGGFGNPAGSDVDIDCAEVIVMVAHEPTPPGITLSANAGSYTVTGSAADFEVGMEADAGSYSVTGSAANFTLGKTLGVESGSYALTGEDVTFLNAEVLSAESGSYAITGEDADFLKGEVLSAEAGSYSYTGADATLTQSIAATLDAESGSYTVTGSDADLLGAFVLETQVTGTEIAYCTEYIEGSTKAWTNEFNAVNGSTANYAYASFEGWVNTDAERINPAGVGHYYAGEIRLYAAIPAANAQADTISKVRYRVYTQATGTGTPQLEVTVRDESAFERGAWSLNWLQQDRFTKTTAGWTDWTDISPPAGGWSTYDPTTWPDTTNGLVAFYCVGKDDTGDLTELRIYKLEVEYTYTDAVYTTALGAVELQGDLDHPVDAGSYTYTGSDANFTLSNSLSAEAGAYSVTGSDADLEYAAVMPVESGSYSLTGSEVTFQTSGAFSAQPGSYTVTGEDVTFEYEGRLLAESGSYALTGESADLKRGYGLDAEDSLYNIGFFPQNAMYRGLVLPAESGSYAVTGADATLAYQFDGALAAVPGAYAYTGADANLLYQRVVNVDAGSYSYTGDDVDYSLTYSLLAGAGSYACSGADATLRYSGVAGRRVIMIG